MNAKTIGLPDNVQDYLVRWGVREAPILARLREETASHPRAQMQIAPEQGALFAILVELLGARQCLEIGTFTGYSSLAVALAMPPDGRLVCCDVSEEYTATARRYWAEAGVADRVDLRIAPGGRHAGRAARRGPVGHVRPRVHRRRQEPATRLLRALRRARPSAAA